MTGKGSAPRPLSVPKEIFDDNFERIFNKKEKVKEENHHFLTKANLIKLLKDFPDDTKVVMGTGIDGAVKECIVGSYYPPGTGETWIIIEPDV